MYNNIPRMIVDIIKLKIKFFVLYIMSNKYLDLYKKIKQKFNKLKMKLNQKEIYLLRHGETEYNKLGVNQGSEIDSLLNEKGVEQATKTGEYLKNYRIKNKQFDFVCASPLLRAKETAEIVCGIINYRENIIYFDELKERSQGKLSGLSDKDPLKLEIKEYDEKNDIKDPIDKSVYKDEYGIKINEKFNLEYELDYELENRAFGIIKKIVEGNFTKILVVSHGGLLYAMIRKILIFAKSPKEKWKMEKIVG